MTQSIVASSVRSSDNATSEYTYLQTFRYEGCN